MADTKIKIGVAGFGFSPNFTRARDVANLLVAAFPDEFETEVLEKNRGDFFAWLKDNKVTVAGDKPNSRGDKAADHATCPLVWFEHASGEREFIGGRDRLCEWTIANKSGSGAAKKADEILCVVL